MATKKDRPDVEVPDPSPYGGERLLQPKQGFKNSLDILTGKSKAYDKQAADARVNRLEEDTEVKAERQKRTLDGYKKGGKVFKGYGRAKKV